MLGGLGGAHKGGRRQMESSNNLDSENQDDE